VLVFDGVKSFAKVKGNDDDKPVDGEEISDGVQDSDDSSCGWSRRVKGEMISE